MRAPVSGLPLAFTGALAAFMLLPRVQQQPRVFWSFAAACAVLLVWNLILLATRARHHLTLDVVLRKQPLVRTWEGQTMTVSVERKVPPPDVLYER